MESLKIVIEKHADGYVSYPIGLKGVVIGQGDTYEQALADIRSAIAFHIDTFGGDAFENDSPNVDGSRTPLTMPNHTIINSSTLRTICSQANIGRDDFINAYNKR